MIMTAKRGKTRLNRKQSGTLVQLAVGDPRPP